MKHDADYVKGFMAGRAIAVRLADLGRKPVNHFLTFSAPSEFTIRVNSPGWNGVIEYSTDGQNWNTWDGSALTGTVLHFRGIGNTVVTGERTGRIWRMSGSQISCTGNIETLLDYQVVQSGAHPQMAKNCYDSMFLYQTSLISAPELPATTLTEECYTCMFDRCSGLLNVPALPATTLAHSCYNSMFRYCASIINVPALPATTLAQACYFDMFLGCTSLKISETKTDEYCYAYRIPTEGVGTEGTVSLSSMFSNTGGTFTGTPSINTTYYTTHKPV